MMPLSDRRSESATDTTYASSSRIARCRSASPSRATVRLNWFVLALRSASRAQLLLPIHADLDPDPELF